MGSYWDPGIQFLPIGDRQSGCLRGAVSQPSHFIPIDIRPAPY